MLAQGKLTVCCPGPSFKPEMTPDEGPVGAINIALNKVTRCDYWICYDTPLAMHNLCVEAFRRHRPTIVTIPEYARGWLTWFRETAGLQNWQFPSIEVQAWEPLWYEVAIKCGPRYSSGLALAWAMQRRFREIEYRGCDMGGDSYCDPSAKSVSKRSPQAWTNRWARERMILRSAQDALKAHGYTLTGMPWDPPVPAEPAPPPPGA